MCPQRREARDVLEFFRCVQSWRVVPSSVWGLTMFAMAGTGFSYVAGRDNIFIGFKIDT
jgi:hypothetical protein